MSRVEVNKGVLIPTTISEMYEKYPNAELEDLGYTTDDNYVIFGDNLYRVLWEIYGGEPDDGFAKLNKHVNGNIEFFTQHYNGGAYWTEVVEDALKKAE